jgi:hypothetical protein
VVVEILTDQPQSKVIAGKTRDISATGVYILGGHGVKQGIWVSIDVDLTNLGERIKTGGTIMRCDNSGFAVEFDAAYPRFKALRYF